MVLLSNKNCAWDIEIFNRERSQIRLRINQLYNSIDPAEVAEYMLGKLTESPLEAPDVMMRNVIYLMLLLVHGHKHNNFNEADINKLKNQIYAILRLSGIGPENSPFSFLYGDMHHLLSKIYFNWGRPWESAIEHQIGMTLAGDRITGGEHFHALALGIRALRLGHGSDAVSYFDKSLAGKLDQGNIELALINKLKALRLSGQKLEARKFYEGFDLNGLSEEFARDVEWERHLWELDNSKNLMKELIKLTKKCSPFYQESYILDAKMYSYAMPQKSLITKFPRMKTLRNIHGFRNKHNKFRFQFLQVLEELYDTTPPISQRVIRVCDYLKRIKQFKWIEHELLAWLAVARWFFRANTKAMGSHCLQEYYSCCLILSDGKSKDTLGIATDLVAKDRGGEG